MLSRVRGWLAHPRAPLVVALLAIVLFAPTIGTGLMMDDHAHRASFGPASQRPGGPHGDWDLFRFLDDTPGALGALVDKGLWPWWTVEGSRLAFFRPLASLSHALDYRFFPETPALMHAESILAFAAAAFVTALFYRRVLGATATAGMAALIFAADDAHAMVVTWIANRHAILSALFGAAALLAHAHARRDDSRPARWLAPLALTLSLLAGEGGLSTLAYLFAYAVFLDRAPRSARVRSLAPYAAIAAGWMAIYKLGGYGARAGAFYIDPVHQIGDFLAAVTQRLPVLLAGQLAVPPADVWMALPPSKTGGLVSACVVILIIVGGGLFAALRRDRTAGFFALGMTLSLLPACATWPSDRLLLAAGLGGSGLIASMIAAPRAHLPRPARVIATGIAGLFVFLHLIVAPLFLPLRARATGSMLHSFTERALASLPDDDAMRGRTLVVVSAPDAVISNMIMAARLNAGRAVPDTLRVLSVAVQGSIRVARLDDRTLAVTLGGGLGHEATTKVFRDPRKSPLRLGDRIAVAGMIAEIAALTPDGALPARIHFRFDRPIDDGSFTFIYWNEKRFAPFVLPAIGEEKALPVVAYTTALGG